MIFQLKKKKKSEQEEGCECVHCHCQNVVGQIVKSFSSKSVTSLLMKYFLIIDI